MSDNQIYLIHAVEAIYRIEFYAKNGKQQFLDSILFQDAIYKNFEVIGFSFENYEKFTDKVIKLKGITIKEAPAIPLTTLAEIFESLTRMYGLFQFETKSETASYVGVLKTIDTKQLVIKFLDPRGKWDGLMTFRPNDIRVVAFDKDYVNSLKLVAKIA